MFQASVSTGAAMAGMSIGTAGSMGTLVSSVFATPEGGKVECNRDIIHDELAPIRMLIV